jgi:hypothetical protein
LITSASRITIPFLEFPAVFAVRFLYLGREYHILINTPSELTGIQDRSPQLVY